MAEPTLIEVDPAWRQAHPGASVGLIESCGYRLVGRGRRTSRFGIRLLGQFRMD